MQVLVLVVQNDARPQNIGVATSTATFFRSVGGSFGVAIFGTIFASRLADELAQLAARVTARLGSGVHLSPEQANQLPPLVHDDFLHAFANALARRVPVRNGAGRRAVRPLVAAEGGAAAHDARAAAPSSTSEEARAAATPDERVLAAS